MFTSTECSPREWDSSLSYLSIYHSSLSQCLRLYVSLFPSLFVSVPPCLYIFPVFMLILSLYLHVSLSPFLPISTSLCLNVCVYFALICMSLYLWLFVSLTPYIFVSAPLWLTHGFHCKRCMNVLELLGRQRCMTARQM